MDDRQIKENTSQPETLRSVFNLGRTVKYQKNEIILRAGDEPQGIYYIESGAIKIYAISRHGNEHIRHFFGKGDIFPLVWLFRGHIRDAFYEALEPTTLKLVSKDKFIEHIRSSTDIQHELNEELVDRYIRYSDRIDNLLYSDTRQRCAYRLLALASRFGEVREHGILITVHITHEDLAHSLNMTRETFGRLMTKFAGYGVISYLDHRIVINNPQYLMKIIGEQDSLTMWPNLTGMIPG